MFIFLLSVFVCAFAAVHYFPDWFYARRSIKACLYYPVSAHAVLFTLLLRMLAIQFCICACLAYPMILFCAGSRLFAVQMFSACLAVSCLTDFVVILFLVLTSSVGTGRIAGYIVALLQSVLRLVLPVFAGNIIAFLLIHPDLPGRADRISPAHMLRYALPSAAVLGMLTAIVFKYRYAKGYLNMQSFSGQAFFKRDLRTKITHPYVLMEWKRICWNKEAFFCAGFKNIVTVIVLCRLLVQNPGQAAWGEDGVAELFLLAVCCGMNLISAAAYSSDPNRRCYAFLPVSPRRIFLWKTLSGFFWNELLVILFGLAIILRKEISVPHACGLFLYGTLMNYACSWFGVFLDFKMPQTSGSTKKLLHENTSRVLVLAVSAAIITGEYYLIRQQAIPVSLLCLSVVVSIGIFVLEMCILIFCKGPFYDTDKSSVKEIRQ